MSELKTDPSVVHYLHVMEETMTFEDDQVQSRLDETISQSLESIDRVEEQLQDEEERHEFSLLRAGIDELRLQFALGKMESIEKLHEIREKLDHYFNEANEKIKRLKRVPSKEVEELKKSLHQSWKDLKFEIALLNARLSLLEEHGRENLSAAKDEMMADLRLIGHYAKENAEELNEDIHAWAKKTRKSLKKQGKDLLDAFVSNYDRP